MTSMLLAVDDSIKQTEDSMADKINNINNNWRITDNYIVSWSPRTGPLHSAGMPRHGGAMGGKGPIRNFFGQDKRKRLLINWPRGMTGTNTAEI